MDAHFPRPDGTQTRGLKGIPYDWQQLLVPTEPSFTAGLNDLIDDEFVTETR